MELHHSKIGNVFSRHRDSTVLFNYLELREKMDEKDNEYQQNRHELSKIDSELNKFNRDIQNIETELTKCKELYDR